MDQALIELWARSPTSSCDVNIITRSQEADLNLPISDSARVEPLSAVASPEPTAPTACHLQKPVDVRKWDISFNGSTCVSEFILLLEEALFAREVPEDTLLRAFSDLLTGTAKKWFRGIKKQKLSWTRLKVLLKQQFDDPEFDFVTEVTLRARKQGASEKIANFVIEVRDLNSKLERPIPEETLFNIIKANLHTEYAHCLIFNTPNSIEELVGIGKKLEQHASAKTKLNENLDVKCKSPAPRVTAVVPTRPCPKCRNTGHTYKECKLPYPVCFKCGLKDFTTKTCPQCNRDARDTQNNKSNDGFNRYNKIPAVTITIIIMKMVIIIRAYSHQDHIRENVRRDRRPTIEIERTGPPHPE